MGMHCYLITLIIMFKSGGEWIGLSRRHTHTSFLGRCKRFCMECVYVWSVHAGRAHAVFCSSNQLHMLVVYLFFLRRDWNWVLSRHWSHQALNSGPLHARVNICVGAANNLTVRSWPSQTGTRLSSHGSIITKRRRDWIQLTSFR